MDPGETGWFGAVLRSHRARVEVPGLVADVAVSDVGDGDADVSAAVDAAYRTNYGAAGAASMVTAGAAATTLRLTPQR